ncbi:MFS transporter [Klebsiella michiganensis]|uniref:MFS transporter n=1 Tax=Klebsiella michiganensis TaxID=1134687 RepID=UPI001FFC890E|nr:MFS transporter [Klebsiella michiganensis]UPI87270.1 MFS transporter [Klebsiella michiganensis]HDX8825055.1 MFS transporter [Klebsiella michiganensis]
MYNSLLPVSSRHALFFCLFLSTFELLTYVASDVVMPGMLSVIKDLNAQTYYVPWSLNAYLLGGVSFQWLIGPASDRFGRRPLLLIGCALFSVSCLATPWVDNIQVFTLLRFIQGIGLGFVVVVSYPALQEAFNESDAIRLIALFANIALLSPLFGPLVGSVVLSYLSWRTLFIAIALMAALAWFGLLRWMPETIGVVRQDGSKIECQPLEVKTLARAYGDLLTNPRCLFGSVALGLIGLPLMAWIALSPLLLVHHLKMSMLEYALWQLPIFGALIAGNIVLNFTAEKFKPEQLLYFSLFPVFIGITLALVMTLIWQNIITLIIGMAIYAFGLGICNATLYRLTLFSSEHGKGSVSAMIGMISVAIFSLGGALMAGLGAGNNLIAYITAATIPMLAALFIIVNIFTRQKRSKTKITASGH